MDRAMEAGIDDVGCGVLFGLNLYKYDFVGILMHAKHLEDTFGCGPHTISVPRVRPADDIDPDTFDNGVPDEVFKRIIAMPADRSTLYRYHHVHERIQGDERRSC